MKTLKKSSHLHCQRTKIVPSDKPLYLTGIFIMENQEIWKDIPGYEGYYQVSNFGRLKSFKENKLGYLMKQTNKYGWYFTVNLQGKNKPKTSKRIHRLVAELFIPNHENLPQVNHKDLNKQNNHYLNLEWVSASNNAKHSALNNPRTMSGFNRYNKLIKTNKIIQSSLDGVYIETFINASEASKKSGVCKRNILQVANKDEFIPGHIRKQAGGFIWSLGGKNV